MLIEGPIPHESVFRAVIGETIRRTFAREPQQWELGFFLPHFICGRMDAETLATLLSRDPEAVSARISGRLAEWPAYLLTGWN